jgi:hypothetical protein
VGGTELEKTVVVIGPALPQAKITTPRTAPNTVMTATRWRGDTSKG